MRIIIPSAGRAARCLKTVLFMRPEYDVKLVVPREQMDEYRANLCNTEFYSRIIAAGPETDPVDRRHLPLPSTFVEVIGEGPFVGCGGQGLRRDGFPRTIADTRQWCDEQFGKQIQLDDDMTFNMLNHQYRLPPNPWDWFDESLKALWAALDRVGFVGVAPRIMSQVHPHGGWEFNTRCMNVHGINPELLGMEMGVPCPTFAEIYQTGIVPVRHDVLPVMEDFYLTLAMARKGMPWARYRTMCWHQNTSNDRGGCGAYRNEDMQASAAKRLLGIFGGNLVKVKTKATHTGDGWERTDVNIAWSKAAAAGNVVVPVGPFWDDKGPTNPRYVG